ncbi:MAG: endonuclease/exonuclease/phosphatase family protein, partial [Shimia sp.]
EADLVNYDPAGRALGSLRAALRRMAEAWVLRREVLASLANGEPCIVLGDFNDGEHAVSSEIVAGERPFKNYAWMRRHDAEHRSDRYTDEENEIIRAQIEAARLHSAERLFVRRSDRDMVFTSAFGGVYQSIDQIFLSRHFLGEVGELTYFRALNDHLTDGSHTDAPYNKLASDHGQIIAHLSMHARR